MRKKKNVRTITVFSDKRDPVLSKSITAEQIKLIERRFLMDRHSRGDRYHPVTIKGSYVRRATRRWKRMAAHLITDNLLILRVQH